MDDDRSACRPDPGARALLSPLRARDRAAWNASSSEQAHAEATRRHRARVGGARVACSRPRRVQTPVLMQILGISCYFHDAAAALLQDGRLIAAAEEERFTRVKHDFSFPERAIRFCLERGNLSGADLDYVAFFEKPFIKFERILQTALGTVPHSQAVFRKAMTA